MDTISKSKITPPRTPRRRRAPQRSSLQVLVDLGGVGVMGAELFTRPAGTAPASAHEEAEALYRYAAELCVLMRRIRHPYPPRIDGACVAIPCGTNERCELVAAAIRAAYTATEVNR